MAEILDRYQAEILTLWVTVTYVTGSGSVQVNIFLFTYATVFTCIRIKSLIEMRSFPSIYIFQRSGKLPISFKISASSGRW